MIEEHCDISKQRIDIIIRKADKAELSTSTAVEFLLTECKTNDELCYMSLRLGIHIGIAIEQAR